MGSSRSMRRSQHGWRGVTEGERGYEVRGGGEGRPLMWSPETEYGEEQQYLFKEPDLVLRLYESREIPVGRLLQ